jgi:hypothetical protein
MAKITHYCNKHGNTFEEFRNQIKIIYSTVNACSQRKKCVMFLTGLDDWCQKNLPRTDISNKFHPNLLSKVCGWLSKIRLYIACKKGIFLSQAMKAYKGSGGIVSHGTRGELSTSNPGLFTPGKAPLHAPGGAKTPVRIGMSWEDKHSKNASQK